MFGTEGMHIKILNNKLSSETGSLHFDSLNTTRKENTHENVFKHYTNLYFKDVSDANMILRRISSEFDKILHSIRWNLITTKLFL